jgi:hypothetical protein
VQSSDDSFEDISIKIEKEEIYIKEEVEPIAISFSSIKDKPEVSPQTFLPNLRLLYVIMPSVMSFVCLQFPHKTAPYCEWKWSVYLDSVC